MIVFRDSGKTNHLRVPDWASDWARGDINGVTYFCHKKYKDMLEKRDDAEWVDVGDGFEAAVYEQPDMRLYVNCDERSISVFELQDVTGIKWFIPALLDENGTSLVSMRSRMVVQEGKVTWERLACSDTVQNALDFAQQYRKWKSGEEVEPDELMSCVLAVISCIYSIPPMAIGCLALIGDGLIGDGMNAACGIKQDGGA